MNSSTPLITVMVLCYNYGHLLHRALEAIGAQSFSDYELLFIDNGSTDNSKQVFEEFCQKHPELNTRYMLVSPNQGPTHGWNMGLQQAHGEYVMFHDADDWMEPNCLEVLGNAARETGADRITGQYQEALPDGTVCRVRTFATNGKSKIPTGMLQASIFKMQVIRENNIILPEQVLGPYDTYFIFKYASLERIPPFFVRQTVYNYLINPTSICRSYQGKKNQYREMFERFAGELIDLAQQCAEEATDKDIVGWIEYLTLRNSYAAIVAGYTRYSSNEADAYTGLIKEKLKKSFPRYEKNPYVMPLGNGYELKGSMAVWCLVLLDKMGIMERMLKLKAFFSHSFREKSNEKK